MYIQSDEKKTSELYHLMVQTIIPRPIAWILSRNENGALNLAPFSFFNGVCSDPPILSFSVGWKSSGEKKDTWRNIESTKQFVVHIASVSSEAEVTASADELDYGVSEIEAGSLELTDDERWPLPRLKTANIAMFCELHRIVEVGNKPQALVLGEIKSFWLDAEIARLEGKKTIIDPEKLDPLGRLGRSRYAKVSVIKDQKA